MTRERGGMLNGVRIIDFSSVIAGPWASHILADFGADVIKIESPGGDIMRTAGAARHEPMASVFMQMHRGKRSVVLDLKSAPGRDAALRLCSDADVVLHNVRPAAMRRLGLAYDDVRAVNPGVVYVSIVGFDQRGPYARRPTYDDLIQGASGIASLFAQTGCDEPRYVPMQVVDRITGFSTANAVLAALVHRGRTGAGQSLEVPMFETIVEMVLAEHLGGHSFEPAHGPFGYSRILTPFRRPYRTLDGYVCLLLSTEAHWSRFFALSGNAERFAADPHLSKAPLRRANYDNAYSIIAEILATRTSAEWLALFEQGDIPGLMLHDFESLLDDPQLAATGFFASEEHPSEGAIRTMRAPTRWNAAREVHPEPVPQLGEHTAEVLREAGLDEQSIAELLPR